MRIAVASSGLGHVARGVETWAADTAEALAKRGVNVTLFSGAVVDGSAKAVARKVVLPCLRRSDPRTERWVARAPGFAWRWGLKSCYGWEQLSFWWRLWPQLRRGRYHVLHVQDPMLAYWCRKFRRLGLVATREILAHGTEETVQWLSQFQYVQHLAPWHLEDAQRKRKNDHADWIAVPNFVDTTTFCPASGEEKREIRRNFGLPEDAFIIGTAATVKRPHKRIDYLIREFASFVTNCDGASKQTPGRLSSTVHGPRSTGTRVPHLFIAGASTPQSDELMQLAEELAPGRIKFCLDLPREQMPDFYRSLDLFALVSLFEMMPIAVLEALATGLPVVCNQTPVLEWMIGEGSAGASIDMSGDGALAKFLLQATPTWIDEHGRAARSRALAVFSSEVVIGEYIDYYQRACAS